MKIVILIIEKARGSMIRLCCDFYFAFFFLAFFFYHNLVTLKGHTHNHHNVTNGNSVRIGFITFFNLC